MQEQGKDQDLEIVIVECCQNCQSHQWVSRHSEWKYFEQFNEIKRKIQRFVSNVIVIKNPIPDELTKPTEQKNQKNVYINKNTNQKVTFPRVGAFEIYIYNILISSKIMSNSWPNHYKIVQTLTNIILDKKKGLDLGHYSVYISGNQQVEEAKPNKQIKEIKHDSISPKKKKNFVRIYKSKDKQKDKSTILVKNEDSKEKKSQIKEIKEKEIKEKKIAELKQRKLGKLDEISKQKRLKGLRGEILNRYTDTRGENRQKLPPLYNTISFSKGQKEESLKKIFNSIEQLEQQQISLIQNLNDQNHYDSLILHNQSSIKKNSVDIENEDIKFVENKSVQYSLNQQKDFMNTSVQYEDDQDNYCDFGLQIDDQSRPKQNSHQFVQTIQTGQQDTKEIIIEKPYMLDEQMQVNIEKIKDEKVQQSQTVNVILENAESNTITTSYVNRSAQFPQEEVKIIQSIPIDSQFNHLYEKKRNILNSEYYSIDKFQEKATKYKWIGRANYMESVETLQKRIFKECLVFSIYNFFGFKTPQKRLSFQNCGNVVSDKIKQPTYHVMTPDNPELHYLNHFEEYNYNQQKFPLSEQLTFKNSKQTVNFSNYGGFLAIAYLLQDHQIFDQLNTKIGLVISNQQVKQIHKLSAQEYEMHPSQPHKPRNIVVTKNALNIIKYQRLSEQVQKQFISMMARVVSNQTVQEIQKYVRQIFINLSPSYQHFKRTILSLGTYTIEVQLVQDFIKSLFAKIQLIKQQFKGQIYCFNKYHSINPTITYSTNSHIISQRRIKYQNRVVSNNQILKHIVKKDTVVIITGESGIGKTTLLKQMVKKIKETVKINLILLNHVDNDINKVRNQLQQDIKNIIAIDNAEKYNFQICELIKQNRNKIEVSYCLLSCSEDGQVKKLQSELVDIKLVHLKLLGFNKEQAQVLMMKQITNQTFTAKKQLVDKLVNQKKYQHIYSNPFYLNQFCKIISTFKLQNFTLNDDFLRKYSILKHIHHLAIQNHKFQMNSMSIPYKQTTIIMRRIALMYFQNDQSLNDTIINLIHEFQTDHIIRNQLVYYPINLEGLSNNNSLYTHRQYLYYHLVQAFGYFLEKGYKNMKMKKLLQEPILLQMMKQKYLSDKGHSRLLQVIYNSRKFASTEEQASNAMTVLVKIGYIFTNLNLDEVNIANADLSNGIFYNCSFRGADMNHVRLYRTQMLHCLIQNAQMANVDLLTKKFQLQFLGLTTSLSPDSRFLAVGCGNYLIVLNTQNGKQVKRIEAHLDVIRNVKYSRDGASIVTIGDDKTLRIWDSYTFRCVVFKLPQKGSITYTNESQTITTISKQVLKIWNIKSMAGEIYCEGHSDQITTVHFSRDGKSVLTGSKDTTLRLWDLSGKQKAIFKGHNSEIVVGRLSGNSKLMFSSSKDKDLVIWDTELKSQLKTKKFNEQVSQICPDLQQMYIVITLHNQFGLIVLKHMTCEVAYILNGHRSRIIQLFFDYHYRFLISLAKDKSIIIWDFISIMTIERNQQKLNIHDGPVLSLVFNKNLKQYYTSHENGEINIWDTSNQLIDQVVSHNGPVSCLAYDKNNKLYSGGSDGFIRVWNLSQKREPQENKIHADQVIKLKVSNRSKYYASSSNANEIVVHDITGVSVLMSTREEGRIYAIDFSKDDKYMGIGGSQKFVVLYEVQSNGTSMTRLQQLGQHSDVITCISFYDESILVSSTKNGHISIWNYQKVSLVKKIQNSSPVISLLPLLNQYIIMSSEDGKIRIIDMNQGKEIKVFRYSEVMGSIDTNQDQKLLYTSTETGNIVVWNIDNLNNTIPKIHFHNMAVDAESTLMYEVQTSSTLLKRDLLRHTQDIITLNTSSEIEGVSFIKDQVIVRLKSGQLWEVGKGQYQFPDKTDYEGDLYFLRDTKELNLFRTPIKKLKGLKSPLQLVLNDHK